MQVDESGNNGADTTGNDDNNDSDDEGGVDGVECGFIDGDNSSDECCIDSGDDNSSDECCIDSGDDSDGDNSTNEWGIDADVTVPNNKDVFFKLSRCILSSFSSLLLILSLCSDLVQ